MSEYQVTVTEGQKILLDAAMNNKALARFLPVFKPLIEAGVAELHVTFCSGKKTVKVVQIRKTGEV